MEAAATGHAVTDTLSVKGVKQPRRTGGFGSSGPAGGERRCRVTAVCLSLRGARPRTKAAAAAPWGVRGPREGSRPLQSGSGSSGGSRPRAASQARGLVSGRTLGSVAEHCCRRSVSLRPSSECPFETAMGCGSARCERRGAVAALAYIDSIIRPQTNKAAWP